MNMHKIKEHFFRGDEIFDLMDEKYFPKLSKKSFPFPELEETVKRALIFLWFSSKIKMHGTEYSQYDIREQIVDTMQYENLIVAVKRFQSERYQAKGIKLLAWLILSEILSAKEVSEMQRDFDFKNGDADDELL